MNSHTSHSRKIQKSTSILSKNRFSLTKYLCFNIIIYGGMIVGTLYNNQIFDNNGIWWGIALIPLFLNLFRFIVIGFLLLAAAVFGIYWRDLSWYYLVLFPIALYLGHFSAVLLHNAVHNCFKPLWLNPVIGEICAMQQLSAGFPVFKLVHYQHHIHSDDLVKDPHPSVGYSFWGYIDAVRPMVMERLKAIYLENWGDTEQSQRIWTLNLVLLFVCRFLKTLFWFALLGPKLFALVFVPSYISYIYLFASFNYFTHHEKNDGSVEILNLDNNWYFKFCNRTLFGVFYHKNHHLKPRLFNPMYFN